VAFFLGQSSQSLARTPPARLRELGLAASARHPVPGRSPWLFSWDSLHKVWPGLPRHRPGHLHALCARDALSRERQQPSGKKQAQAARDMPSGPALVHGPVSCPVTSPSQQAAGTGPPGTYFWLCGLGLSASARHPVPGQSRHFFLETGFTKFGQDSPATCLPRAQDACC